MPLKIRKRPGSRYWWVFGTVAHRPVRQSLGVVDYALAEHKANQLEAKILQESVFGKERIATFSDACVRYYEDHPVPKGRRDQMSEFLVPIIRKIGKVRLSDINPGLAKATARKLYPGRLPQSLNTSVIAPISAVVNNAHQHGWCAPIRIKKFPARGAKIQRAADREWLYKFMSAAPQHLAALALFQFETGARPKEACSLRQDQLDLNKAIGWSDETKNGKRRIYYLSEELVALLRSLPRREINGEMRVFGYVSPQALKDRWRRAIEEAGIEYFTRYEGGRHSHFTETITRNKADVPTAAKLGNVTPAIALQRYAKADAPEKLAKEVFGNKSAQGQRKKAKSGGSSKG